MADEGTETVRQSVSKEEMDAAYRVPAPGSNKFVVHLGQPGVRITFGELNPGMDVPAFHSAVTLHPQDAITLYKLLEEMLRDIEERIITISIERKDA